MPPALRRIPALTERWSLLLVALRNDVNIGYFMGSFQINAVGGWRFMYGFSASLAILMGLGMSILPASPRWLLLKAVQGKCSFQDLKEKAIVSLSKLRGRPAGDKNERQIEETIVSLKSAYEDQESEGNFLDVFQGPNLKAFIIGGGLVLFQQEIWRVLSALLQKITGQPTVLYYAGPILQSAGFSAASDATKVSVIIGLFKLLMTWFAIVKVDDLWRRPLLIGGFSGIVGILSHFKLTYPYSYFNCNLSNATSFILFLWALSLVLLSAYYKFLGGLPVVAVGALLLYVGCYQELELGHKEANFLRSNKGTTIPS